jgi:hypothetical protein
MLQPFRYDEGSLFQARAPEAGMPDVQDAAFPPMPAPIILPSPERPSPGRFPDDPGLLPS